MSGMALMSDESDRSLTLTFRLHDAFTDDWLKQLRAWIRHQVDQSRLPSDFSEDCIQDQLLHALSHYKGSNRSRAIVLRISKDALKRAALSEYAHHGRSAFAFDDAERALQRSRSYTWLRNYLSTNPEEVGRLSDADLDEADARRRHQVTAAMKLLKESLTRTQRQLLELRYVTLVPGQDRCYKLKEIAPILGRNYSYIRRLHAETIAQVRQLLAGIIAARPLR